MLYRASPVLSLALLYAAGYHSAPVFGRTWGADMEPAPALVFAAAVGTLLAACLTLRFSTGVRLRPVWVVLTLCCFLLAGLARGIQAASHSDALMAQLRDVAASWWDGETDSGASRRDSERYTTASGEVKAIGLVVDFPSESRNGTRFVMELWAIEKGGHSLTWSRGRPRTFVTVRPVAEIHYGDLLRIDGELVMRTGPRNPGGFDFAGYLSAKGIHGTMKAKPHRVRLLEEGRGWTVLARVIGPIRRWVKDTIGRRLDGEAEALLYGLLLGDRSLVEPELRESMARAGVIHILAVSGLHVGLVALILLWGAKCCGLGGRTSEWMSALGVCFYCAMTGFPASACRATTMLIAYIVCRRVQRAGTPLESLAAAAFVLTLLKPGWVSTPGFQLSFAAAAGVLVFKDCLVGFAGRATVEKTPGLRDLLTLFGASLGASIATWPLLAFHFGRTPLLFLLGNMFAVPLVGLVLAWGISGVLLGALSAALSDFMFASCWAASRILLFGSRLVAAIPWASIDIGPFSPALIPLYFIALVAAVGSHRRKRAVVTAGLCLIATVMCLGPIRGVTDDSLEVTFLDVGHGDACETLSTVRPESVSSSGRNPVGLPSTTVLSG